MSTRIAIRNISDSIRRGEFDKESDVEKAINDHVTTVLNARDQLIAQFRLLDGCGHDFKNPTYSVQKRVLGFVTVYERKCNVCGYKEIFQQNDKESLPDWTDGATETYYNNDI